MSPANLDIDQQIAYWRTSSQEDSEAARSLLDQKHVRHALFFLHLSLEILLRRTFAASRATSHRERIT